MRDQLPMLRMGSDLLVTLQGDLDDATVEHIELAAQPYGTVALFAVSLGVAGFGAFGVLQGRYRRI